MPVGAIIGGAASIAGSIIGGKQNSKAISKASDAQAAAVQQATQLQRDIYNKNVGIQQPFLNTGMAAMGQINALLGLNVPQGAPAGGGVQTGGTNALPIAPTPSGPETVSPKGFLDGLIAMGKAQAAGYDGPFVYGDAPNIAAQYQAQQAAGPAQPTQTSAQDAYNQFKNYTGYTSRLNEANNALNSAYAAKGTLQSGAALKEMARFNQDYASNEFGNYMGYLGGQQQLGPGAANALAGVGTNYANAAGGLAMQNGNNLANAAIAKANNSNSMWQGIAGGIGSIFGSGFGGSSFGKGY